MRMDQWKVVGIDGRGRWDYGGAGRVNKAGKFPMGGEAVVPGVNIGTVMFVFCLGDGV